MSKHIHIPNGIVTIAESKAICPYCKCKIPIDKIDNKWDKSDRTYIRMKCNCGKFIGITCNIKGDFVAYELRNSKQ